MAYVILLHTISLFFPYIKFSHHNGCIVLSCRESMKAEAVGLTWYEWWEDRTEDDVLRDEKEQQEVEYEDDSDGINGDLSDGSDNFNF